MGYRNELLKFITEGRQEEMGEWIRSFPNLERLQIMDEFKELVVELAEQKGIDMDDDLDEFEAALTDYQEKILDEQLASLKLEMAEKDMNKTMEDAEDAMKSLRTNLVESILSNPPNVDALRKMANDIMQIEKDNDVFDPQNWKGLL